MKIFNIIVLKHRKEIGIQGRKKLYLAFRFARWFSNFFVSIHFFQKRLEILCAVSCDVMLIVTSMFTKKFVIVGLYDYGPYHLRIAITPSIF